MEALPEPSWGVMGVRRWWLQTEEADEQQDVMVVLGLRRVADMALELNLGCQARQLPAADRPSRPEAFRWIPIRASAWQRLDTASLCVEGNRVEVD
jgi:hypothetical protein